MVAAKSPENEEESLELCSRTKACGQSKQKHLVHLLRLASRKMTIHLVFERMGMVRLEGGPKCSAIRNAAGVIHLAWTSST